MRKEILLFQKDKLSFKQKFYVLMDLLITNQVQSRIESFILLGIFYLQIITSFFSTQIGILDYQKSNSDKFLNLIQRIIHLKDLLANNYFNLIIIFEIFIILIIHFIFSCIKITRKSYYSFNLRLINFYIKIFIYVAYNIILDMSFGILCFRTNGFNYNYNSIKCSYMKNIWIPIVSIFFIAFSLIIYILLSIFYNDSFYLSDSYYAKMSCNYDILLAVNSFAVSCLSTQVKYLTKEIFLLYNLISSILQLIFYLKHYLYYDKYINVFTGIFHILYAWTSIFCLIFAYINLTEKGIIYIITSIIITYLYFNIKNILESKIFIETPYYKIENKFYILFYLRNIIEKINNIKDSNEDKSLLSSIIEIHSLECSDTDCLLKTKEDLYLPLENKWSEKNKRVVEDEVFLKNFIIIIMNHFIRTQDCTVDMLLNLSLYQLKIIGNFCQAMYYYQKILEYNLSLKEYFSLVRLENQISKALFEKLKPSNETCTKLKNLNISQYYKYESLSQNFIEDINNDINLSLEFWNSFAAPLKEEFKKVDFNNVFKLIEKIRFTKKNIENIWNELLKLYDGVNDFFLLYLDYIEQINDDDLKRRDLEVLKRKNDIIGEHINFNSILFSKETGIIIANGDKGNEGIIQLANNQIENIFNYNKENLKGMNISCLMPKIFAKEHSQYISRYVKIGESKYINKSMVETLAKNKNNYIIKIKLAIKLFPILNKNIYFAALIMNENIDNIILLDNQYFIQGMSSQLMKKLNINNTFLFQENEIPFYMICKKFVNFYNIFLKEKKKNNNNNNIDNKLIINEEKKENKEENEDIHDNIEINENMELEYEIKLPQFLIDYSEKVNKNEKKNVVQLMDNNFEEIEDMNDKDDKDDDFSDEKESLLKTENNKNQKIENLNKNNINIKNEIPTPTPTPTPDGETPNDDSILISNSVFSNEKEDNNIEFTNYNKEEKIYKSTINQYKTLFSEGKIDELENLIDSCNKNSSSIEYKFNFTFDKYKYGNKKVFYIVRCIENKKDIGNNEEETEIEKNPKLVKFKKEKNESIKPLFEILEEERKKIIELPEEFLKLSLENKKFQILLQNCKNDIISLSKAFGGKKDQVLEDENSSQSSLSGFDKGLLKKNRVEEIRSNIMKNVTYYYTLKLIKLVIILIAIISIIFSFLYAYYYKSIDYSLINTFKINIHLYKSTFYTIEIINIFISLKVLYTKYIIQNSSDFDFNDYLSKDININQTESNVLYYNYLINYGNFLYENGYFSLAYLEEELPLYLSTKQFTEIFWEVVNITYMAKINIDLIDFYPLSIYQLLSNALSYLKDETFNNITEVSFEKFNNNLTVYKNHLYFKYITHLIIENGYINILPSQLEKLSLIPNILYKYNLHFKKYIILILLLYACFIYVLFSAFIILFHATTKHLIEGMIKFTKIRLEKLEEIIKRIKLFGLNLKKFKKRLKISEQNNNTLEKSVKENNQIYEDSKNLNTVEINKRLKDEFSLINSNTFNIENKKYTPLTILNKLVYPAFIFSFIIYLSLIPIYFMSLRSINGTNLLLLVQKFIYGKLIQTSLRIAEIKCYMSKCQNQNPFDYESLINMSQIQEMIKGINLLPAVSEFYNNKFLLNACSAAIDQLKEPEKYSKCENDPIIISAKNSDNLIKLINDYIDNIKKEYEIRNKTEPNYDHIKLFNSTYFQDIEHIQSKYIIRIQDIFTNLLISEHENYLNRNKFFIYFLAIYLGLINILFCIIYGIIIIKRSTNYLIISRFIIKIIPVSAILSTQELESWIESKY